MWVHLSSGGLLGMLWMQSAYMGHDSGHYQMMTSCGFNTLAQILTGNCLTGISIAWWKWTHNAHHLAVNSLDHDPDLQHIPVFFEERFDDESWEKRWVVSEWKKAENASGVWNYTAGRWYGDPNDKGIQTSQDLNFYAISAEFPKFSNKNRTLVFQFSVKHEQKLHCGGGYLKLLSGDIDQKKFGADTPYSIMFGPDICGHRNKKVQAILNYNGTYHSNKKNITAETDQLTHVYTFVLHPNATYKILIDNENRLKGSLYKHWDLLPPKKIQDPDALRPEDCDDRTYIDNPEDRKPVGHGDIPKEIQDPDAEEPDDWDEEENGDWDEEENDDWKPPTIGNPNYKRRLTLKQIKNPNCNKEWKVPLIDNPDFKDDPDLYVYLNLKYVGTEVWQVKSGSLFDKILITDDPKYAMKFAEETWGKIRDAEKASFKEFEMANKHSEAGKGSVGSDVSDDINKDKDALINGFLFFSSPRPPDDLEDKVHFKAGGMLHGREGQMKNFRVLSVIKHSYEINVISLLYIENAMY